MEFGSPNPLTGGSRPVAALREGWKTIQRNENGLSVRSSLLGDFGRSCCRFVYPLHIPVPSLFVLLWTACSGQPVIDCQADF
jgi:hypothetical protein